MKKDILIKFIAKGSLSILSVHRKMFLNPTCIRIWIAGLILLLVFLQGKVMAQSPASVTVELSSTSIRAAKLPFDVRFDLTGKAPDDCFRIEFEYSVDQITEINRHPKLKNWITMPGREIGAVGKSSWSRDGTTFSLRCAGMHPNVDYNFKFTLFKNVPDNDAVKTDLKQKIGAAIQKYFAQLGNTPLTTAGLETMADQLELVVNTKLIGTATDVTLRKKGDPSQVFKIDLRGQLQPSINKIFNASQIVTSNTTTLYDPATGLVKNFLKAFSAEKVPLTKDIDAVLNGDVKLTDDAKLALDRPVAPDVDAFKSLTLRNGLLLLKSLNAMPIKMNLLLKGNAKIVNNDVAEVPPIDPASISYLSAVFSALASGQVQTVPAPASTTMFTNLNLAAQLLSSINAKVGETALNKTLITTTLGEIPDITNEIVISQVLTAQTVVLPDITAQDNAYISAEAGFAYAASFQSMMSYVGVNFYFTPVNKQAELKTFRGIDRIGKMLSLSVGYSTLYNDRPLHTYSVIGNDTKSDIFVGLGLRFSQVFKLNFSVMPYRVSYNPLTDDKTIKAGFVGGLGLDINLLPILGTAFTKGLKLTP